MEYKLFLDTNALLNLRDKAFTEEFFISQKTLEEIENIKSSGNKDGEVKYKARAVSRLLDKNYGKYTVIHNDSNIAAIIEKFKLSDSPDNIILASAYYCNESICPIVVVTDDLNCRFISREIFGLITKGIDDNDAADEEYKGYKDIMLSDDDMCEFYSNLTTNLYDMTVNEYIIIRDLDGNIKDTLKWNGTTYDAVRCKPYKSNMFGVLKPLDEIQAFAMDSINTNDITVLYGKAGSGKTTIPLNYLMQGIEKGKFKKLYIVYSYEPLKNAKTLGYEKGDHTTKLLYSASIGNILASKFGDISQVEYLIERNIIDIIPTANIRGVEFEADSCLLVTESQNLDVYTLKTIIQRCKDGCKQIYEGDIIEQKDTNVSQVGVNRLIEVFKGHSSFGCVKLKNNYRSTLCELADKM